MNMVLDYIGERQDVLLMNKTPVEKAPRPGPGVCWALDASDSTVEYLMQKVGDELPESTSE